MKVLEFVAKLLQGPDVCFWPIEVELFEPLLQLTEIDRLEPFGNDRHTPVVIRHWLIGRGEHFHGIGIGRLTDQALLAQQQHAGIEISNGADRSTGIVRLVVLDTELDRGHGVVQQVGRDAVGHKHAFATASIATSSGATV